MTDNNIRYQRNSNVVKRQIAGETLLVPICGDLADLQQLFSLNDTGNFIWERLDGTRTIAELNAEITECFSVEPETAEEDCRAFLDLLQDNGLIRSVADT